MRRYRIWILGGKKRYINEGVFAVSFRVLGNGLICYRRTVEKRVEEKLYSLSDNRRMLDYAKLLSLGPFAPNGSTKRNLRQHWMADLGVRYFFFFAV